MLGCEAVTMKIERKRPRNQFANCSRMFCTNEQSRDTSPRYCPELAISKRFPSNFYSDAYIDFEDTSMSHYTFLINNCLFRSTIIHTFWTQKGPPIEHAPEMQRKAPHKDQFSFLPCYNPLLRRKVTSHEVSVLRRGMIQNNYQNQSHQEFPFHC